MTRKEKHSVPLIEKPLRLSDYAVGIFKSTVTKKGMKKAIDSGLVKVNGVVSPSSKYINGGEIIVLSQSKAELNKPTVNLKLEVLHEDDHLAVIIKPAGIVVSGNKLRTIENALVNNLEKSTEVDALIRPQAIHRLDFPTSGVLLIGKTRSTVTALNKMFENKEILKTYHAITTGVAEKSGTIKSEIKTKKSHTDYKLLKHVKSEKFGQLNLIELDPKTGRRHQIRIHLASIKCPIVGDNLYGKEGKTVKGKGLFLHATAIKFEHPTSKETVDIQSELPKKFLKIFPTLNDE